MLTLAAGINKTLTFEWTPNQMGRYEIKSYTSEIPGDINPEDNTLITNIYASRGHTSSAQTTATQGGKVLATQ